MQKCKWLNLTMAQLLNVKMQMAQWLNVLISQCAKLKMQLAQFENCSICNVEMQQTNYPMCISLSTMSYEP